MTKIFCDIADLNLIKKFDKKKIVKGFTTNPSLISKTGAEDYKSYCKKILKATKKPISIEVFADDVDEIIKQGIKINKWGKKIFVKVPVINSKGKFMGKAISYFNKNNIKINVTAVYTINHVKQILKNLNKSSEVLISIFAGRMADSGKDPLPIFKKSLNAAKNYKNVKILWASVREPYNFLQSKKIGCHVITIPPAIIEKIEKFGKSYKDLTQETVNNFLIDSKKSKFKI